MALHLLQLAAINFFLLGLTRKPFRPRMWWHIFCMWEWESSHGSCARGLSVANSSCNFDGKGGRTQWSRYLWNLVLTSNFMCSTDLRRFPQRLMTCPFENIVALKRLSQFWFPQCSCMRQCLVFSSGYCYWSFSTCVFKCLFYMCAWKVGLIHCLHLFDFSPLCVFKCLLKSLNCNDEKSHWLHLFHFSPLCVFKCLLKLFACEDAKSHWLHLFDFSLLCVLKCILKWPTW